MKPSNTLSDGTKTTSYLGRTYRKIAFWLWFPVFWTVVKFKNKFRDVDKLKMFGVKWENISEMPIYNWIQILETEDLKWLFKTEGIITKKVEDHWIELQQQYINEFGLEEKYKQRLRLMEQLRDLNNEFVLTRDRFLLNLIKICEADIQILSMGTIIRFNQMVDHVEKYKGFSIDPKTTSVMKWYYSLKNMSRGN